MGSVKATIDIAGLDAYIHQRIREGVEEALGARPENIPWLDSKAAAEYLGVSRQRIHDLSSQDVLAHHAGDGRSGDRSLPGLRP